MREKLPGNQQLDSYVMKLSQNFFKLFVDSFRSGCISHWFSINGQALEDSDP